VSLALWGLLDKENKTRMIFNSLNASLLLKASITGSSMGKAICVPASSKCPARADVIWVYLHHGVPVLEFLSSLEDTSLALGHVFYGFLFNMPEERKI